jgi:hypothetical protein
MYRDVFRRWRSGQDAILRWSFACPERRHMKHPCWTGQKHWHFLPLSVERRAARFAAVPVRSSSWPTQTGLRRLPLQLGLVSFPYSLHEVRLPGSSSRQIGFRTLTPRMPRRYQRAALQKSLPHFPWVNAVSPRAYMMGDCKLSALTVGRCARHDPEQRLELERRPLQNQCRGLFDRDRRSALTLMSSSSSGQNNCS